MVALLIMLTDQKMASEFDSYLQLVSVLIIFIVVLGATYYATKWIANYMHNQNSNPYSNFEVIDTYNMGPNHRLMILKVGKNKLLKQTFWFINVWIMILL